YLVQEEKNNVRAVTHAAVGANYTRDEVMAAETEQKLSESTCSANITADSITNPPRRSLQGILTRLRGRQRCTLRRMLNAAIQWTLTFHHLCYKSHLIGGESIAIYCAYFQTSISHPAVALATTQPTRHT
ncbi:hypothetical protein SFRURICE_004415, partial [Spodoptera frugiperda]